MRENPISLPRRSARLFALFRKYARRYLKRHFHAVRVLRDGPVPDVQSGPLVVVANHPSWWDPLVGLVLTEFMNANLVHYSPIDINGLRQYPFLERLGFFGVELGTKRGSFAFLRQCQAILAHPESVLWITPQGGFVDPRERPIVLKEGIGHLAFRQSVLTIVPLALEYPFWNDRCPEILVGFGEPVTVTTRKSESPQIWTRKIERALEETQDRLAREAQRRDPTAFVTIVGGTSGVGGIYESWRRFRAMLRGERFHPEHQLGKEPAPDQSRLTQGV